MKTLVSVRSIWDPQLALRIEQTTFVTAEDDFFARYPKGYFMVPTKPPRKDQLGKTIDQSLTIEDWKSKIVKKYKTPEPMREAAPASPADAILTSGDLKQPAAPASGAAEGAAEGAAGAPEGDQAPEGAAGAPEGSEAATGAPAAPAAAPKAKPAPKKAPAKKG